MAYLAFGGMEYRYTNVQCDIRVRELIGDIVITKVMTLAKYGVPD